ncbi:MAG: hypothetical protein IT279_03475, partial [Ignavibacteriaceae bacterium]|nr:hypothetical protein [Ignavibacteriaceae bacterium]
IVVEYPDSENAKVIIEIAQNLAAQISIKNIDAASKPKMEIVIEE